MSITEILHHSERLKGLIEKINDLAQKTDFNQHVIFKVNKQLKQNEFITKAQFGARVDTLSQMLNEMFQDKINEFFKRFNSSLAEKINRTEAME